MKSLPDLNTRNPRTHDLTSALAKHAQALKDHEARVQAQLALMGSSKGGQHRNSVKSTSSSVNNPTTLHQQPRSFDFGSHHHGQQAIQPAVQSKQPITTHYDFQSQPQQPITTHHDFQSQQPITNHHDEYGFSGVISSRNQIVNPHHQQTPSYPVQEQKEHHVSPVHYEGKYFKYIFEILEKPNQTR